jgi:sulfite exporter TauE/SafE/copper chaperone CopZ
MNKEIKEHKYFVQGTHCASCEVLIEKKLLEFKNIKSVEASVNKEEVLIEYEGQKPSPETLNRIFKKENYIFSDQPPKMRNAFKATEFFTALGIGLLIILGFIGLNKLGLSGLVNVDSKSSLPTFFLLGIIAGVSTCAALVGGIILSMSKQWNELYSRSDSTFKKIQPHLLFNIGRIISYGVLGTILGGIGAKLNFSLKFAPILVIAVSVIMILLALQMLGVKALRKFQLTMPKFITRRVADESKFKGRHMPFLMGALTFFLPCGFTITAQSLALLSQNAVQGGLIMLSFALGTLPLLLFIGLSSVKFSQKTHSSHKFVKVAGILVFFFALYNINSQLNVLGFSSLNNLNTKTNQSSEETESASSLKNEFPPIVNGQQVIKMNASSSGYSPNYFKVKAGIPVRWEITDQGTSGCTNAIVSKNLFSGEIALTPGKTSIQEFTPQKPGKYKFSCWMGMVSGTMEVIAEDSADASQNSSLENSLLSTESKTSDGSCGARGFCGCGGR